jgi:hypothetical protein
VEDAHRRAARLQLRLLQGEPVREQQHPSEAARARRLALPAAHSSAGAPRERAASAAWGERCHVCEDRASRPPRPPGAVCVLYVRALQTRDQVKKINPGRLLVPVGAGTRGFLGSRFQPLWATR